uniref:(California timema) hypothetical protein n=1 Tax=Timema californicum TaxID=61474 RepID=A0A7R9JHK3_TIMCA|nr:unnamed protein product [Timema californicum]
MLTVWARSTVFVNQDLSSTLRMDSWLVFKRQHTLVTRALQTFSAQKLSEPKHSA